MVGGVRTDEYRIAAVKGGTLRFHYTRIRGVDSRKQTAPPFRPLSTHILLPEY